MIYQSGSKVKLVSTGEVGVVIHSWKNPQLNTVDYHVAFYGTQFPVDEPENPPYVLRYSEASLKAIDR